MKIRRQRPQRKQATPAEMTGRLLELIQAKFYQGMALDFTKQRRHLLHWVVLWPASWFEERGVTIGTDRYFEILSRIFIEAAAHGNVDQVKYFPAWLMQVVQSHFKIHGEDYYEEAKSVRNAVENAMLLAGAAVARPVDPDPMKVLAEANRALSAQRRPKAAPKSDQLSLL